VEWTDRYGSPITPTISLGYGSVTDGERYPIEASVTSQEEANTPRPNRLFPSRVEELHFEDGRRIIRTYHLLPDEDPMDISMESFTREGYYYTFADITRNRHQYLSTWNYVKAVEITTSSNNINTIMGHLTEYIEHETWNGYSGILFLDLSSVHTQVSGTRQEGFTATQTRTFPNLSNPDVALVPQTITANGREYTLQNVSWSGGTENTVDYTRISSTFTATATYTRRGTRNVTLGYITTAEFRGELSRIGEGETTYIATFIGIALPPIVTPPDLNTTIYGYDEHGNPILGFDEDGNYIIGFDANGNPIISISTANSNNDTNDNNINDEPIEPFSINWGLLIGSLTFLSALGIGVWFFFLRGNVEVYNLNVADGNESFIKIGRAKVSKRNNFIIDLSPFTDKAATSAFRIDIPAWVASRISGNTITVNYGSNTLQHEIAYEKGQKKYQVEFDF